MPKSDERQKNKLAYQASLEKERETGLEPATACLGSKNSYKSASQALLSPYLKSDSTCPPLQGVCCAK